MLDKNEIKQIIARRVAEEFHDGDVVTLGIGLPTLAANYISPDKHITLQSENGILGVGKMPDELTADVRITNAGGQLVTIKEGGAYFDSFLSFSRNSKKNLICYYSILELL